MLYCLVITLLKPNDEAYFAVVFTERNDHYCSELSWKEVNSRQEETGRSDYKNKYLHPSNKEGELSLQSEAWINLDWFWV